MLTYSLKYCYLLEQKDKNLFSSCITSMANNNISNFLTVQQSHMNQSV